MSKSLEHIEDALEQMIELRDLLPELTEGLLALAPQEELTIKHHIKHLKVGFDGIILLLERCKKARKELQ